MKRILIFSMLLYVAASMNAQTIVKGDMNDDNELTITDAVSIVNVILGNAPIEYINIGVDAVDNTSVVGTWYAPDGTSFLFHENGTTTFPGAATYKFRPLLYILTLYDITNTPIKAMLLSEVTSDHLLAVDLVNGSKVFTEYTHFDHEFVDLGLPSKTLWATCNVGAKSPEEYGDYFAWGETVPYGQKDMSNATNYSSTGSYTKTKYDWSTYKWCMGSSTTLTKYCNDSSYGNKGFTDILTELDLEDDAAYVNWGTDWRMPNKEQFDELINSEYTTTTWTQQNGVYGLKITSIINGNSIFLPAAGWRDLSSLSKAKTNGLYWSRSLNERYSYDAWYLSFGSSSSRKTASSNRFGGKSVRPVRISE